MKKILVIEDNQMVRENLAEVLELSNYEVVTAENGKIGVEKAQSENPDLILCDVMMPVLDGFGVLRILDKSPKTADTYRKKDFLYQEGDHPKRLYFIASGQVKTFRTNDIGKEYITHLYKAGDFIGYNALLREQPYNESAMVTEESDINYVPKEDFFSLLYNNRNFSARFIKMLANNTNDQEQQLLSLAYSSIRKRVAEALVKLDAHNREKGNSQIAILRDDLAGMVGTAKESVIRTLTDFKQEGLISVENSLITILNLEELEAMPN